MLHRVIACVSARGDVTVAVSEDCAGPPIGTNAEYLELAVRDLHENAVQRTDPGGRFGGVSGRRGFQSNDGPIIPPEELTQLGTRFFRGGNRHSAGRDLGLAIAKAALSKVYAQVTIDNRGDRDRVMCNIVLK